MCTHAGPTTAGVVSTAVMVLRAARLVIAIALRSLNSAEERGTGPEHCRSCANRQQRRGRLPRRQRISASARTRQNTTSPLAGRARRRAGGALWRACERNGLDCRFSLLRPLRFALSSAAPRSGCQSRAHRHRAARTRRPAAPRPDQPRADVPGSLERRSPRPSYFLAIRTFPPTSFKAGRPCMSELLAKAALQVGHRHSASASASAPSRLASRPAESSDILSM